MVVNVSAWDTNVCSPLSILNKPYCFNRLPRHARRRCHVQLRYACAGERGFRARGPVQFPDVGSRVHGQCELRAQHAVRHGMWDQRSGGPESERHGQTVRRPPWHKSVLQAVQQCGPHAANRGQEGPCIEEILGQPEDRRQLCLP